MKSKSLPRKGDQAAVLLMATFDTKREEALFLRSRLQARGVRVLTMDVGGLAPGDSAVDVPRARVMSAAGHQPDGEVGFSSQSEAIEVMSRGAAMVCRELSDGHAIQGVIAIGGAQGTEIGCAGMRALPMGVPRVMLSTIACGRTSFGSLVGTSDLTIMHSVADLQGLNLVTTRVLDNAAGAIAGMVSRPAEEFAPTSGIPVALSMLGTTTRGALRCKSALQARGFEVIAFHQNGTGGIAMEDMTRAGAFEGVLDLNLHEIADRVVGGLHGAIRDDRLAAAGEANIPRVVAPGSINYAVMGPVAGLVEPWRSRPRVVHNSNLTLVRLSVEELARVGELVGTRLNRATGLTQVFVPLRGLSSRDAEGSPHWHPEGNMAFVDALKAVLRPEIPLTEIDAHINDDAFIDPVVGAFLAMMRARGGSPTREGRLQ